MPADWKYESFWYATLCFFADEVQLRRAIPLVDGHARQFTELSPAHVSLASASNVVQLWKFLLHRVVEAKQIVYDRVELLVVLLVLLEMRQASRL